MKPGYLCYVPVVADLCNWFCSNRAATAQHCHLRRPRGYHAEEGVKRLCSVALQCVCVCVCVHVCVCVCVCVCVMCMCVCAGGEYACVSMHRDQYKDTFVFNCKISKSEKPAVTASYRWVYIVCNKPLKPEPLIFWMNFKQ